MTGARASASRQRIGWIVVVTIVFGLAASSVLRPLQTMLMDLAWRTIVRVAGLHAVAPIDDPVVIGIDEATLDAIAPPIALWHRELAQVFSALADAAPRAVLVDIALPERSFDAVLPDIDAALMAGVQRITRAAPTVFALGVGPDGAARPLLPALAAIAGPGTFALAVLPLDGDGRVRRFANGDDASQTLAGRLATRLGRPAPPRDAGIDYATGRPFTYLSLKDVLTMQRDRLDAAVRGRVVAVGSVLAYGDRVAVPVPLAAWEPDSIDVPGVIVHAQALRTLLAGRTVRSVASPWSLALALLCTTLWWIALSGWRASGIGVVVIIGLLALHTALLAHGRALDVAPALLATVLALAGRKALDAAIALRERARLRASFAGYVSPQVLDRLLDGQLDPTRPDGPREMAFLFADLRGFTTRAQHESALHTVAMLNRYYDAIIGPVHAQGGMVDNFRGDGIMVVFGAPQPVTEPARAAVLAARGIVDAVRTLNAALALEGLPALEMGMGIACGHAVAGEIGSRHRHDYTAIGDAVNVAARLQDLCRVHGVVAVATTDVAARLQPGDATVVDLGLVEIRGHAAVASVTLGWT